MQTRSFLGVTLHFGEHMHISSATLGVYELDERHTAEYIAKKLDYVCHQWKIKNENVTAIVSDGAANITKAIEMCFGKIRHIHCFAHQLNLVAEKSIKSVDELCLIISKIKTIVTWFKRSLTASDELRNPQKDKSENEKKLIQEVPTRWNSTFMMLQRFLELREHINSIINRHADAPPMITAREMNDIRSVQELLKPLEAATNEICGQKYTTSSIVIPTVHNLENKISGVDMGLEETGIASLLKCALLTELKKRLAPAEKVHLLAVATLIDPRFKKLYFKDPLNCAKAVELIEDLQRMNQDPPIITIPETKPATESKEATLDLWSDHQKIVNQSYTQTETVSETSLYLRSNVVPLKTNPLEWWTTHHETYSKLALIAKKILTCVTI